MKPNEHMVAVRVDKERHMALRAMCFKRGVSISTWLRQCIDRELAGIAVEAPQAIVEQAKGIERHYCSMAKLPKGMPSLGPMVDEDEDGLRYGRGYQG